MSRDGGELIQPRGLPRLPLPVMEEVLSSYLDALASFTPDLRSSNNHVRELGAREDLIEYVRDKSEQTQNWAYDWWLSDMYLSVRLPLPINSNPGMVFPRVTYEPGKEIEGMLIYATRFTLGLIDFKVQLETGSLPIDTQGKERTPLCMKQYERLLNFYRRPGLQMDEHVDGDSTGVKESEAVGVFIRGHIYKMPVKLNGEWKSGPQIHRMLHGIFRDSRGVKDIPEDSNVALLTSQDRRIWGSFYKELMENEENAQNLIDIASSLFILCLDEEKGGISEEAEDRFRQVLTGNGPGGNGGNRWFDKTLQIIVSPSGLAGLCYEHSPAEGVAVVNTLSKILLMGNENLLKDFEKTSAEEEEPPRAPLRWTLTPRIKEGILQARDRFEKDNADLDVQIFSFEAFGKDLIKSLRCSPDAFTQLALQLTYFRLYNHLCPTYESASTRRFASGRVDCIRSSHPEALSWVKAMRDPSTTQETRLKALKVALEKQSSLIQLNISGHGLDVPLLGLRKAAEELTSVHPLPELFSSPEYAKSNAFSLSTSQIPISLPGLSFMGYGPVVRDGWGAAYNIGPSSLLLVVSTFKSGGPLTCKDFVKVFEDSLLDMRDLFLSI